MLSLVCAQVRGSLSTFTLSVCLGSCRFPANFVRKYHIHQWLPLANRGHMRYPVYIRKASFGRVGGGCVNKSVVGVLRNFLPGALDGVVVTLMETFCFFVLLFYGEP